MEVNNNTVIKGDSDTSGLYEQNDYNDLFPNLHLHQQLSENPGHFL